MQFQLDRWYKIQQNEKVQVWKIMGNSNWSNMKGKVTKYIFHGKHLRSKQLLMFLIIRYLCISSAIYMCNWTVFLLTHWGQVMHICVSKLTIIGSDNGLSPGRRQAIYLNQCGNIVNWTLRNKLQWNFNQNSNIFIQENAPESVVCEMAAI